jgi:hypothetical protein
VLIATQSLPPPYSSRSNLLFTAAQIRSKELKKKQARRQRSPRAPGGRQALARSASLASTPDRPPGIAGSAPRSDRGIGASPHRPSPRGPAHLATGTRPTGRAPGPNRRQTACSLASP